MTRRFCNIRIHQEKQNLSMKQRRTSRIQTFSSFSITISLKETQKTALANPNSLVLSKEIAQKFFGNQSAINKIIRISSSTNGDYDFKVTGVFVPSKVPSHIDARLFMSLKGGDVDRYMLNATSLAFNNMYYTYMVLRNGANPKQLEAKFPAFIDKYAEKT
jgi:putative ABC transport system permease protein